MACRCSPSLDRARLEFGALGHPNVGCCGDEAHQARKSDHNADESGYAHAQDIGEKVDHGLQWWVDRVMANPAKFPQVKYLIYERHIYYPNAGARPAGKYAYTGPNAHATHCHISIHSWATHYEGDWLITAPPEEDDMYDINYDRRVLEQIRDVVLNLQGVDGYHQSIERDTLARVEQLQSALADAGVADAQAIADAVLRRIGDAADA